MNLDCISIGRNPPEEVNAIIEVPIGGEPIKYEMDKKAGTLVVDRFLYTPMRYPGNYGFIPHTLSADGDPCDILIANTRPIVPGAVVAVRPIGVLKMMDEAGSDEKIIAVPIPKLTQRYAHVRNYTDLPEITWRQIEHFFAHYKDLEEGKVGDFRRLGRRRRGQALYPRGASGRKTSVRRKIDDHVEALWPKKMLSPSPRPQLTGAEPKTFPAAGARRESSAPCR